jgi:hypothetical protein
MEQSVLADQVLPLYASLSYATRNFQTVGSMI